MSKLQQNQIAGNPSEPKTETMKCIKCATEKSCTEFEKRSDTGKYRSQCKACRNEYVTNYRRGIADGSISKKEVKVDDNKKVCVVCKETKDLSEFQTRDTKHGYRHECKSCKQKQLFEYYQTTYNEVRRNKKKNDIQYKLLCQQRMYLYKAVTKYSMVKQDRTLKYVGCSLQNLKNWLEFQFDKSMTWESYGKNWTIDHVLPLSLFDLTKESDQKVAFHWTNLQPLTDNFSKGNKIRLYEFFNVMISAHRFIQTNHLDQCEYQNIRESLCWLREKLR